MSFSTESVPVTVDPTYQTFKSCNKPQHFHQWPTTGELEIERCEHYCLFCCGPKSLKKWSSAWFLRRHVRETHAKLEYPGLIVSEGWSKRPAGNTRPIFKKQRAPGSNKKRAGTKKDRLALIKMLEENGDLADHILSHAQSVFPQRYPVSAPTAVMVNTPAGFAQAQSFDSSSYSTGSPFTSDPAQHVFQPWLASPSAPSMNSGIDPSMLELFPELSTSYTSDDTTAQATDAINFDDFINDPEDFQDSALGTSVVSSIEHTMSGFDSATSMPAADRLCNADFAFAQKLTAALQASQPTQSSVPFGAPSEDTQADAFGIAFSGSHLDSFHHDMHTDDFGLDAAFDTAFFADA